MRYGQILREERLDRKLSLRALARELGVSPACLCDIEHERRMPSERLAARLADVLELEKLRAFPRPPVNEMRALVEADPEWAETLKDLFQLALSDGLSAGEVKRWIARKKR